MLDRTKEVFEVVLAFAMFLAWIAFLHHLTNGSGWYN